MPPVRSLLPSQQLRCWHSRARPRLDAASRQQIVLPLYEIITGMPKAPPSRRDDVADIIEIRDCASASREAFHATTRATA